MSEGFILLDDLVAETLGEMTPDERAEFDAAIPEVRARMRLAELIYHARTEAGLSQQALAQMAGTRQATISAIESGGQAPGGVTLERIAVALGCHVGFVPAPAAP